MSEPIIAPAARTDLDAAWDYLAGQDPRAADRLIDRFAASARLHAQFPEAGRMREEIAPGLRSFLVHPYVVFYRCDADTIVVLRCLHGRRDVRRIMKGS